jgi:SAM-dependent methyltransferase
LSDKLTTSMHKTLLCPDCRGSISFSVESNTVCINCGYKVDFCGSIPLLLPTLEQTSLSGMEKTFALPALYNRLIELKAILSGAIPHLGVQEVVGGKHVLDVGCGPTVKAEHAEHEAASAASYTGIELSLPFLRSVREENPDEPFFFAQASINAIPFPDKSFDTTIVSFVIHHVPGDPAKVIEELMRVTRRHLVIYDHLRSDNALASLIQSIYWGTFDGGCNYMTRDQWSRTLVPLRKIREIQNGPFGQVLRMILEIPG